MSTESLPFSLKRQAQLGSKQPARLTLEVSCFYKSNFRHIRESVDSLCRDGARTLNTLSHNFTTNTRKAYLSAQASSLSAFVISKTHISGQKPHGRQPNAKVRGSESAIFRILHVQTTLSNNDISEKI